VNQVSDMMQRQFGLKPKLGGASYRKPYLEWYDLVMLPNRYKIPDFAKFTKIDSILTMEHIS
jgi:hypothetical protein